MKKSFKEGLKKTGNTLKVEFQQKGEPGLFKKKTRSTWTIKVDKKGSKNQCGR